MRKNFATAIVKSGMKINTNGHYCLLSFKIMRQYAYYFRLKT